MTRVCRFYVLLFVTLFLVSQSCGTRYVSQKEEKSTTISTSGAKYEKSLLWLVEKDGLHPLYLYGTIHAIPSQEFFLTDATQAALADVGQMVMELDVSEVNDPTIIFSIMDQVMMKDDLSLSDLLSDEEMDVVSGYFGDYGVPLMFLDRIKPIFLQMMVDLDLGFGVDQEQEYKLYEMELNKLANEMGVPTEGLESIDFQIRIFDQIPYEHQAKALLASIRSRDQVQSLNVDLNRLYTMYKDQDIEGLLSTALELDPVVAEYGDILLTERNKDWVPKILSYMSDQRTFVAVGAAHLAGKEGVLTLLKKHGCKLTPLY